MRRVLGYLLSLSLLITFTPHAYAHSTLVSSNPKSGAILNSAPTRVSLTFNENLLIISGQNPNSLEITSATGNSPIVGPLVIKGNIISIPLKSKAQKGRFKVSYRVVSADGHPIQGSFFFTIK